MPSGRIRVLGLVDRLDDSSAGAERAALALAVNLPRDRFDVWLCTSRLAGGEPLEELLASGARHVHLGRTATFDLAGHRRFAALLRALRPDVLHAHMYGSNVWGSIFGRVFRVPAVVAHEHTWSYEGQYVRRVVDGLVIGRLADAFLAVSSADAERMHRLERVPRAKIEVVPNAWSPRPAAAAGDLRTELGIPAGAAVAAAVMLMRPQKRLDVLLDAFARLRANLPDARLIVAGDGEERAAVEAGIVRRGLGAAVHLLGYREDTAAVWAAADVMVMSSDFEGMPLSLLEALAAGVPVVATNVGGIPDVVDERCSILVERRDPEALARGLATVLSDPDRRAAMAVAARARAGDFTVAKYAERCAGVYERLLAARLR